MRRVSLRRVSLRNFKGVSRFVLEAPAGENLDVFGTNGAGKTTIADAFAWALWGKDSVGASDFAVKTLDPNGEAYHGLEHEVTLVLAVDDDPVELRRVYSETWAKKRGSAHQEFTGHSTSYYVDGVPVKAAEYEARVTSMLGGSFEQFILLTDPLAFAERLHWQERRRILWEVVGGVDDTDVIAEFPELAQLGELLTGKRTVDDLKEIVLASRKRLNRDIEQIPVRIDEQTRVIGEAATGGQDIGQIRDEMQRLEPEAKDLRERIAEARVGGGLPEARRRLEEARTEMAVLKARVAELRLAPRDLVDVAERAQERERRAKRELEQIEADLSALRSRVAVDEGALEKARREWDEIDAEAYPEPAIADPDRCSACGQELPVDQVQEAHEKARRDWMAKKSRRLEDLTEQGRVKRQTMEATQERIRNAERLVGDLRAELKQALDERRVADERLAESQAKRPTLEDQPEFAEIGERIAAAERAVADAEQGNRASSNELEKRLAATEERYHDLSRREAALEHAQCAETRIEKLREEERELAAELERAEETLALIERFARARVELIDTKINSHFQIARFQLFREQVNGGLADCCEVLVGGVPYSKGLNHGSRINAGLDVMNTLSRHYGIAAPVFIDRGESVVQPLPTAGQQIRLVVSESDERIRVETYDGAAASQGAPAADIAAEVAAAG